MPSQKISQIFVFALFIFLSFSYQAWSYNYGPACQWIRFLGKVETPEQAQISFPLQISIQYRLPEQKHFATLLTNYPLPSKNIRIFLAGFFEKIQQSQLVSPMFFFKKPIEFRYYVKSRDGRYQSSWQSINFSPKKIEKEGEVLCQSQLNLPPIILSYRKN